jgi:hypothetical protein
MIFKIYKSDNIAQYFFNCYFWGGFLLALLALIGFFTGAGILSTIGGFSFILAATLLSLNKKFRKSPFSIFFCFYTLLYLNIPIAFILFEGSSFVYGGSVNYIPFAQNVYKESLPLGFFYLLICWVAIWLAIISVKITQREIKEKFFHSISLTAILFLGVIVFIVSWNDIQNITAVRIDGAGRLNSLITFIYFDYAYLMMAGLILFFKSNELNYIVNSRRINLLMSAIFIGFIILFFEAGAKSAPLAVFTWFVLFPFAFFRVYSRARIPFLSIKAFVIILLMTMPLYYFAMIKRTSLAYGTAFDLGSYLVAAPMIEVDIIYEMFYQILYRLSQGGLDQFLLIFQSFIVDAFDLDTATKFAAYLGKNTLNQILPGTPFPEAYIPSSMLFHQIIEKNFIGLGDIVGTSQLIKSLNTQPYTIFGFFIIFFCIFAPVFLYLFSLVIISIFGYLNNIWAKSTVFFFFVGVFTCYGFEIAIGNCAHFFASAWLMYFMLKIASRFLIKLSFKSRPINL